MLDGFQSFESNISIASRFLAYPVDEVFVAQLRPALEPHVFGKNLAHRSIISISSDLKSGKTHQILLEDFRTYSHSPAIP